VKLRIEIESKNDEQDQRLRELNAQWPVTITVTVNGMKFDTIRYEEV
jgi:hypothetical protein